jgi:hypothetical protein
MNNRPCDKCEKKYISSETFQSIICEINERLDKLEDKDERTTWSHDKESLPE